MPVKVNSFNWAIRACSLAVFSIVLSSAASLAQLPTATILGVVRDNSGAVVPDANLTVRSEETGFTRSSVTANDGSYRFSALPVGQYEVRVEHPGFNAAIRAGLTLTVSQEAVVNFSLEVGAVEQTVEVTAEAPLVNTTSGTLGGLVNEQKVADLPLNGRNYVDLAFLQPGVQPERSTSASGGAAGGGGATAGQFFSSNGAPVRSNNFMLDGALMQSANDASDAAIGRTTLGVEGIREFRIVTNSFSAEYGMRMGSQMVIVSKSGSNAFHGSMFEYLRNSAMDARNFFDYRTPTADVRLPAFRRNQFGVSGGGPIKKDKTFFFAVYEGLRERLGTTNVFNVLPASAKVDGGLVPQIAPVVKPIVAIFPNPNLPNNQFTFPYSQPTNENYGQLRMDQTISTNDTLFGRWTIDDDQIQATPTTADLIPTSKQSRNQYSTLSETHIFTPAVLNTARFSFSRTNVGSGATSQTGPQYDFVPGQGMGQIMITGLTNVGQGTAATASAQNVFSWSDDLYYTKGRHSLKFGTLVNRFQPNLIGGTNGRGKLQFASIQSFLLGIPSNYTAYAAGTVQFRSYRYSTAGFYAQDDMRATSRLTLNLGLRYEFQTTLTERFNHGSAIRDLANDATATVGAPFENPSLRNISPRFGFAWDVRGNGKTAIRGGFGLLYDIGAFGGALKSGVQATPPFSGSSTVSFPPGSTTLLTLPLSFPPGAQSNSATLPDYHLQQPHMLQYNFTVERQLPFDMGLTIGYAGSRGMNIVVRTEGNPTSPQILPDGREFWTGLESRRNRNWGSISLVTDSGDSWYNAMQFVLNKRLSKGLQFQSSYTWSKVLDDTQGQISAESSLAFPDPGNIRLDRAPAGFDITQNWRLNTIYRLRDVAASRGVAATLLNGWMMTGVLSLQSGYPFSVLVTANRSRSQANLVNGPYDRPDLLPGRNGNNVVQGTSTGCTGVPVGSPLGIPNRYFDPCAFTLQPSGFLGNAGRDILRGPGLANLDFSLVKDTAVKYLGESGRLEFRAEVFNILNRPNFSVPGAGTPKIFAGSAASEAPVVSAARITTTEATSRQIQMALKLIF